MAIQSDGKILAGTSASSANGEVDRFTANGQLDSSFGSSGRASFSLDALLGLAMQSDGRILASLSPIVGGTKEVTRLLSNGSTDTSFGQSGFAYPPGGAGALSVLGNGDILVFGGLISRITSAGAVDATFGVEGQLLAPTAAHVLPTNGDIVAGGSLVSDPTLPSSGLAALAYQSIGIGDPSFGKNGGVLTPISGFPTVSVAGMGLESTGDIVELASLATTTSGAFGLVRYTPLGQLDTSFGSGGTVTTSFNANSGTLANAIAIQSDDKIIAAGTFLNSGLHGQFTSALVLARYKAK